MKIKQTTPYILILPAYTFLGLTFFYPIVKLFQYSFFKRVTNGFVFTGLDNLKILLADTVFFKSIQNNLLMLTIVVPALLVISIVIAVVLYERIRGWRIYRFCLFMPYVLPIPVVGIVFIYIFQGKGILNTFLEQMGLGFMALNWLGSSKIAIYTIMFVIIWKEAGLGIVIFLARLLSLDEALYDAAAIDGANWFQRLFYITIPQLSAVIEFYLIFAIITVLSWVFNYVYVMTAGGPGNSTYVTELYIFNTSFRFHMRNVASMASLILLIVVTFLIFVQFRIRGGMIGERV